MLRKRLSIFLAALLALAPLNGLPPALAEVAGEDGLAEWTVLFYFCGSDLESRYGYASGNMLEMTGCTRPTIYLSFFDVDSAYINDEMGEVNVLLETGGSAAWRAGETLGFDIAADRLQRWRLDCVTTAEAAEGGKNRFLLEQELPGASMADPETLSDFIRWGTATCPAEKYALVLWGHGEGSRTGMFIDENYGGDVMRLDELHDALDAGGADFELVLFDACMMANIETAWAVHERARWMVASEEVVPGPGTAAGAWLQELYNNPTCTGRQLGRCICDMTQQKYANLADDQANSILTFSLIDLDRIERLAASLDSFFELAGYTYEYYPDLLKWFTVFIKFAEEYGNGMDNMIDIGSIFYHPRAVSLMDVGFRAEMLDALTDAVDYCVKGPGRSAATGLSFYHATQADPEGLELYAHNCPSPHYLAFLDAISPWTAPDWVYEQAERLTEIGAESEYRIKLEKTLYDGQPAFIVDGAAGVIYYRLYRLDEATGQLSALGRSLCTYHAVGEDLNTLLWSANEPWLWPAIDGEYCDIEMVSATDNLYLYNIPVRIGTETWFLRCGREFDIALLEQLQTYGEIRDPGHYKIYGLWEGYESDSRVPTRNVASLAAKAGVDYQLLYPVLGGDPGAAPGFMASREMTMFRSLEIGEIPLKPGTYYIEYELEDIFGRSTILDRVETCWDGEDFRVADDTAWEGRYELDPAGGPIAAVDSDDA